MSCCPIMQPYPLSLHINAAYPCRLLEFGFTGLSCSKGRQFCQAALPSHPPPQSLQAITNKTVHNLPQILFRKSLFAPGCH